MKQKMGRTVAVTVVLIVILILVMLLNSMVFVQGPYLREKDLFYRAHEQVMEQMRAREGELVNRYVLDEITYISKIRSLSRDWIVWYDEQGKVKEQVDVTSIDVERALEIAHQMGIDNDKVSYGWINERPALLFEDRDREILLDVKTLDVLLNFEKR